MTVAATGSVPVSVLVTVPATNPRLELEPTHRWDRYALITALFLGAFLLFLVQPIVAKAILPWFGGTSTVWTTCLMFFQVVLLAGYAHAYGRAAPKFRWGVHLGLLVAALLVLPIEPTANMKPALDTEPLAAVLGVLASTGPMLQSWYAQRCPGRPVYRLYALSNAASLLALLSYPFTIEPYWSVSQQARAWSVGFGVFALLCAWVTWRSRGLAWHQGTLRAKRSEEVLGVIEAVGDSGALALPSVPRRADVAQWVLLAAMGTMMLTAVSLHVTQNVAAIPLLWLLPLSIYLFTFMVCFDRDDWYRRRVVALPVSLACTLMAWAIYTPPVTMNVGWMLFIFLGGLLALCWFFHGELSARRPAAPFLTQYYLACSLGGVIGNVVFPLVLNGLYELPLLLLLSLSLSLLMFYVRWEDRSVPVAVPGLMGAISPQHQQRRRTWASTARLVLCSLAWGSTAMFAWFYVRIHVEGSTVMMRNFYAVSRVKETIYTDGDRTRSLMNGRITHGTQIVEGPSAHLGGASRGKLTPTTYFGASSGIAQVLEHLPGKPCRIGIIGPGAGTLAAYGREGDHYQFYEINPHSVQVARDYFSYLKDTPATTTIAMGDARLLLEAEVAQGDEPKLDVLVIDAFSGDSIPMHLMTHEAMQIYRKRLNDDGVIAFHVSNFYLNLAPLVANLAQTIDAKAVHFTSLKRDFPEYSSTWVLVTRHAGWLDRPEWPARGHVLAASPSVATWTDVRSDLLGVVRW